MSNLDFTPSLNSRFKRSLSILTSLIVIFFRKDGSNNLCSVLASRCSFSDTLSLNQIGCNSFFSDPRNTNILLFFSNCIFISTINISTKNSFNQAKLNSNKILR